MTRLSDKLQRATEGSRELDYAIKDYLNETMSSPYATPDVPRWTTSLQDAVSLLPPGPKKFVLYAGPQADDGETVSWGCELGFWVPAFNTEGAESELSPWAMVYGSTAALTVCAAIVAVKASKAEAA